MVPYSIIMSLSQTIGLSLFKFSKRQNHKEDGANLCGLLRKAEIYNVIQNLLLDLMNSFKIHEF